MWMEKERLVPDFEENSTYYYSTDSGDPVFACPECRKGSINWCGAGHVPGRPACTHCGEDFDITPRHNNGKFLWMVKPSQA